MITFPNYRYFCGDIYWLFFIFISMYIKASTRIFLGRTAQSLDYPGYRAASAVETLFDRENNRTRCNPGHKESTEGFKPDLAHDI